MTEPTSGPARRVRGRMRCPLCRWDCKSEGYLKIALRSVAVRHMQEAHADLPHRTWTLLAAGMVAEATSEARQYR